MFKWYYYDFLKFSIPYDFQKISIAAPSRYKAVHGPHHQILEADETSKSKLQWSRLIAKVVSAHLSHDKQELFDSYRENINSTRERKIVSKMFVCLIQDLDLKTNW